MFERLILPILENGKMRIKEFYVPKKWLRKYLLFRFKQYNGFIRIHSMEEVQKLYITAKFRGKIVKEKML